MQQTGVAMTSASNLPCQNIYFVSMEKFSSSWDKGVLEVLNEAGNGGVTSIALPLLGSGKPQTVYERYQTDFNNSLSIFITMCAVKYYYNRLL